MINRQPTLQNEPGEEFNYNNSAFALATIVVERVTGRPFAEWMRDEVFLPLGMTKTWVRANPGQIIPGRSNGYIPGEGGFREVRDLHGSAGAGGIHHDAGRRREVDGQPENGKVGRAGSDQGADDVVRAQRWEAIELRLRSVRRLDPRPAAVAARRQ